jgi:hypothetical protein
MIPTTTDGIYKRDDLDWAITNHSPDDSTMVYPYALSPTLKYHFRILRVIFVP